MFMVFIEEFAYPFTDGLVRLVIQIGQRDAHRHIRRVKTATIHQNDRFPFGQLYHKIYRLIPGDEIP